MSGFLDELARIIFNTPQESGEVRPGFGLETATGISPYKPTLEQSFAPDEQADVSDLRTGLANIILGGGAGAIPGVGQRAQTSSAPARVFHGTRSPKPLRNRPGLHVGTRQQAGVRGRGGRVEEFEFNPAKTAKMRDILHAKEFIVNKMEELRPYLTNAEFERVRFSDHPRALLNRILRKKGFDAIEYENRFEGPGTSYEVLNLSKLGRVE
jgi:hypothetical protein